MKYLVLGAGLMGYACVFDLVNSESVEKVTVIDINENNLEKVSEKCKSNILTTLKLDINNDKNKLVELMKEHNTVLSVISYRYNYDLTKLAIENGCNFCDLGGNNTIVDKQYTLNEEAKVNNVTIIPDCGLAPGLASNLAVLVADRFDSVEHLKIRVGGLPQDPEPPMNYSIFFSAEGLVNEYYEIPILLRNHVEIEGEPLGDHEYLSMPGYPDIEAFNTSGGTSTLPRTLSNKVKNLDYKTIRYKGHRDQCKILLDLGLMDYKCITVDGKEVVPRNVLMHQFYEKLPVNAKDVVLVRVEAEGILNGQTVNQKVEIVDKYDEKNDISAMMRMTSYPLSVIAQMMGKGEVKEKGVVPSELVIDNIKLVKELRKRNIDIKEYESNRMI
ncbi:MAG: saccharopine dehydrogenase C-terminal domain-containing protein [Cyanobacteriota bacterium]